VHHGERTTARRGVAGTGARSKLTLYGGLPEDTAPPRRSSTPSGARRRAVAFDTDPVRHLLRSLVPRGSQPGRSGGLVTGVGPTCAESLRARGVTDLVVPDNPKLGPLFAALATRLAERRNTAGEALRGTRT
jgi:hypothetical protein